MINYLPCSNYFSFINTRIFNCILDIWIQQLAEYLTKLPVKHNVHSRGISYVDPLLSIVQVQLLKKVPKNTQCLPERFHMQILCFLQFRYKQDTERYNTVQKNTKKLEIKNVIKTVQKVQKVQKNVQKVQTYVQKSTKGSIKKYKRQYKKV